MHNFEVITYKGQNINACFIVFQIVILIGIKTFTLCYYCYNKQAIFTFL